MRPPKKDKEFAERVVKINRVTRVVKGGRRMRFRATVVVGDYKNRIALGVAKANEVSDAVTKAGTKAKNSFITIPIIDSTIPHQIIGKFGSTTVILKPAPLGSGVIAGGAVRNIFEITGVKNISAKTIGSRNKINASKATLDALKKLQSKESIYQARGKKMPPAKLSESTPVQAPAVPKNNQTKTQPAKKPVKPQNRTK
ncbi:MAG: 30S ribosomal protein S5 [Patescibacteria group bacterium]